MYLPAETSRFLIENKREVALTEVRVIEILRFFVEFMEDKLAIPSEVAIQVYGTVSPADKETIVVDKLVRVVKNSVFADLLSETYGIEISKLTFIIHSRQTLTQSFQPPSQRILN